MTMRSKSGLWVWMLGLIVLVAPAVLGALTPSWAEVSNLVVLEPGYRVTHFEACGYGYNQGEPTPITGPGGIRGAACTPGSPWWDVLLLTIITPWDDYSAYVEWVDFSGNSGEYVWTGPGRVYPRELAFSPLGWRGGDLLFVNIVLPVFPYYSYVDMWTPIRDYVGTLGAPGAVGRMAVDPSGDFDNDLFYEAWLWPEGDYLGILRKDAAGNTTLFSMVGGVGRFGPGGEWGTGLYDAGTILHPDASLTTFPVDFGKNFDWVPGPGFNGDMFATCGTGICRIKPDGTSTLFATGASGRYITSCGGVLWIPGEGDCRVISWSPVAGVAEISPSTLNVRSRGTDISFRVSLSDTQTGALLDPSLLSPAWVSKVSSPGIGTVTLPTPNAEPGCDDATEDGIWETFSKRLVSSNGDVMSLRFSTPSDGLCATMDGDRQDIIALLLDVPDGETVTICVSAFYPGITLPVEACGTVTVLNSGNR